MLFSRYQIAAAINRKLCDYAKEHPSAQEASEPTKTKYRIEDLEKRLDLMKQFI